MNDMIANSLMRGEAGGIRKKSADYGKPRLLVTTTTLPRFENDPEPRFVLDLARSLVDHFDVTILAPSFPGAQAGEQLFGIDVIRYRYAPWQAWEQIAYPGGIMSRLRAAPWYWPLVPLLIVGQGLALRRLMRRGEFDLIHAHWTLPQGLLAATLPKSLRVPFVTTAHGGDVYSLGRGPMRALLRTVLRRAAAITVVSSQLRCDLLQIADDKSIDSRVHCIPMGVDIKEFRRIAGSAKRPDDLPGGGPIILFVGRLAEKKGLQVLIDALNWGPLEATEAKVVVIGDGPLMSQLVEHAARVGVSEKIHFLGARAHDRLPAYLTAADIFVLPSIRAADGDTDGLPVTLIEAAACGVPAVASNIAGIPEFLVNGQNGRLVPPGDTRALASALDELLRSAPLRNALGAAARTTAEAFDWSTIATRYQQVLANALQDIVIAEDQPLSPAGPKPQHHASNRRG